MHKCIINRGRSIEIHMDIQERTKEKLDIYVKQEQRNSTRVLQAYTYNYIYVFNVLYSSSWRGIVPGLSWLSCSGCCVQSLVERVDTVNARDIVRIIIHGTQDSRCAHLFLSRITSEQEGYTNGSMHSGKLQRRDF